MSALPPTRNTWQTAIPWYVHPAEEPDAWAALPLITDLSMAVLNVADGPGSRHDPYYPPALAACVGVPWIGYVNLAYGRRPVADVLADARTWRKRYGITDLFLDCVPGTDDLRRTLTRVLAALRHETRRLVGNPGVTGDPHLVDLFDVTVVIEDTWERYRTLELPAWHGDVDPRRLWHLVHACPVEEFPEAHRLAGARPVGHFFVTDRTLPNPWRGFPNGVTPPALSPALT